MVHFVRSFFGSILHIGKMQLCRCLPRNLFDLSSPSFCFRFFSGCFATVSLWQAVSLMQARPGSGIRIYTKTISVYIDVSWRFSHDFLTPQDPLSRVRSSQFPPAEGIIKKRLIEFQLELCGKHLNVYRYITHSGHEIWSCVRSGVCLFAGCAVSSMVPGSVRSVKRKRLVNHINVCLRSCVEGRKNKKKQCKARTQKGS